MLINSAADGKRGATLCALARALVRRATPATLGSLARLPSFFTALGTIAILISFIFGGASWLAGWSLAL